ncbi:hypothetical protein HDU98_003491 [Podochytrium sp. JEL0797]|nr:hypothetical protein HDU98_003491 [Podochytrium sp. JEL0797]
MNRSNSQGRSREGRNNGAPPRSVAPVRSNSGREGRDGGGGGGGGKWAAAAAAAEDQQRNGGGAGRYAGWENVHEEDDNYDDEGWLSRKTRAVQDDSVNTTRRALQKARDAEDMAGRSLNQLNQQSEQLHRIEHRLDTADGHAKISEAKTGELKALNRWFFLPSFGASKKAKEAEDRYKAEMLENERRDADRRENVKNGGGYYSGAMGGSSRDVRGERDGRDRGGENGYRGGGERGDRNGGPRGGGGGGYGGGYGKSYTTPDGLDRDEMEEEIDGNLDEISGALHRLKMMGQTMGQEIESQTTHIRGINDKTDMVKDRVDKVNRDISKINGAKGKKK